MASSAPYFRQGVMHQGKGAVKGAKSGTVVLNPPNPITDTNGSVTFTLTGARAGDLIHMQRPSALEAGLAFDAEVTADDTVTVYVVNATAGTVTTASLTWRYIWIDLT